MNADPHHKDSPEELTEWKALKKAKGMWKDRENIVEEMEAIRREGDRSFFIIH